MTEKTHSTLKKIDHIGIAVYTLESNINFYQNILHLPFLGIKNVETQKVRVAMFKIGESILELLEPTSDDSPIKKFLDKRGQGIHHLCFDVEDIEKTLENLKKNNINLINDNPVIGAKSGKVAFLHPKSTGSVLIELSEDH